MKVPLRRYSTKNKNNNKVEGFYEYSSNADNVDEDEEDDDSQWTAGGRNKRLLSAAREGIAHLNRAAALIQSDRHTSKNIFVTPEEEQGPDKRQLAEQHKIFTTTQDCLEALCTKDMSFPLMAGDEPILLVGCSVNSALTYADVYWCLPPSVLTAPDLNERQVQFIHEEMHERIQGAPGRQLAHCVTMALSYYYPPKVRFKAAPDLIVNKVIQEYED